MFDLLKKKREKKSLPPGIVSIPLDIDQTFRNMKTMRKTVQKQFLVLHFVTLWLC